LTSTFTVSGSYAAGSLVLTLSTAKYGTWQFKGVKNGSTITGTISSASYPDLPVSLTKQ
jgi:hypothetical protein